MLNQNHQPFVVEIIVLSAEGLKPKPPTLFSLRRRLKPFIILSTTPPPCSSNPITGDKQHSQYKTKLANESCAADPIWGDKFHIPLGPTFFPDGCCIFLRLFTGRLFSTPSQLGWCRIPSSDIGQPPVGSVRHLSYRLRNRDGSRSHVVVNLAVKLEPQGMVVACPAPPATVMGIPVATYPCRELLQENCYLKPIID